MRAQRALFLFYKFRSMVENAEEMKKNLEHSMCGRRSQDQMIRD
jgi:lipopolysaccharide/colanic/teichoic acid biosynthesis glycosyltransferase